MLRYRPEHFVMPARHRVSLDHGTVESAATRASPVPQDEAMMQAAMAMTELLNGFSTKEQATEDPPRVAPPEDDTAPFSEPTHKRPSVERGNNASHKKIKIEDETSEDVPPKVVPQESKPSSSVFHHRSLPTSHPVSFSGESRNSVYEEVTRSCGLPKSLSFRKICSRCGKTRGEHGENGFGNKCVYQQCGKCGASVQRHTVTGHVMGVLCQMSVREGATAGAAALYERKIRELARRADLQRGQRVRPLTETCPEIFHPGATIASPPRVTTMAQ